MTVVVVVEVVGGGAGFTHKKRLAEYSRNGGNTSFNHNKL